MLAAQRPCPVLKRFSSTHSLRGSSWPGGQTDGTATREWFTTSVADHSAHQVNRAGMSSAGWFHHIGRLEERRKLGGNMMSTRNGRLSLPITFFNNFAVASSRLHVRWGGGMLLRTGSHGSGVGSKVPDTMRIVAFSFTSRRLV